MKRLIIDAIHEKIDNDAILLEVVVRNVGAPSYSGPEMA